MPNQLKRDPTRTTLLRRKFMADMTRRFKKLSKAIKVLVVDVDCFGLEKLVVLQVRQAWRFQSSAQKVKAFRQWLQQQVNAGILTPVGGISGKPWTAPYIESAYKKGTLRAYTDLRAEELANYPSLFDGGQAEFLRTAFASPVALHKIELLYERAFSELQGVTDVMGQQMSRTLSEGLAQGYGANKIARNLVKDVSKITKTRANVIARTEIVRAHAEGQLDAFELLGVEEVGVMAEWSTAGDERVCIECGELEGVVMTIKEARGLLPRHPNCRCSWIPANVKRHEKGQLWGRDKDRAIGRSIGAEAPKTIKRTAAEVTRRSPWAGKDLIKAKKKVVPKPKPKPKPKPEPTDSINKAIKGSSNPQEAESIFEQWFDSSSFGVDIRQGEAVIKHGMKKELLKFEDKVIGKRLLKEFEENARLLNKVLDKVKPHEGVVYRGGIFTDYKEIAKIRPGDIWNQAGTVSTSISREVAEEAMMGRFVTQTDDLYLLVIKSKSGVRISGAAPQHFKYQKEVLLRRGSSYEITKVLDEVDRYTGFPVRKIFMQEI